MAPRFPTERTESYLQFLTTPTADTPGTTLLLHFNSKRYLIGQIAEGTQRVAQQRATRLNKLSDIFVTGPVQYATVGGLLGLLLTLADMQQAAKSSLEATKAAVLERRKQSSSNPKTGIHNVLKGGPQLYQKDTPSSVEDDLITVHGAKNLTYFMASAREFILRPSLKLRLHEIDEDAVTTLSSTVSNQITSTTATMQETVEEPGGGNPTSTQEKWPPTWRDEYIQVWAMIIPPQTLDPLGSSACPASPRKRRHAELDHDPSSSAGGNVDIKSSSSPNLRGDKIRQAIISSMFSANQNPRDKDADVQSMMTPNMSNTTTTVGQGGNPNRSTVSEESFREDINNPPDETSPAIPGLVRRPRPDPLLDSLPPTSPSSNSLSYIIKTLPQRGKFLPDRAKALKVPPGVLYRRLTSGFSVIATDGKTITPDMVLGDTKPSEGVAVLDIPAKSYVDSVVNRQEWKSKSVVEGLNTMIWILGPGVSQDSSFQAFVKSLPDVKHVISSPDHCPNYLAFESGASMAVRLHHIDPVRYPLPVHQNEPAIKNRSEGRPEAQDAPDLFVPAKRGLTMRLTTSLKTQDENSIPALDTKQVWDSVPKEALRLSRLAFESLDGSVEKNDHNSRQCDLPGKDAEIITLGTGSMMPSKYRNVSATLVRVPGVGAYLFDCGENTLGQLRRAFPAEEVNRILRELKAIWISHLHADHHLGLVPIIKARHELVWPDDVRTSFDERWNTENRNPAQASPSYEKHLFVISNSVMLRWLEHFSGVEDIGYDRIVPLHVNVPRPYVPGARSGLEWRNLQLDLSNEAEEHPIKKALISSLGLADIQAVFVDHCYKALAVSLTFPSGFKISYSGDCRPSDPFAEIGRDSTVLVHEATFDDELQADAISKKHSTTSEALSVAVAMRARRVILTHFSQRYPKIPHIDKIRPKHLQLSLEDPSRSDLRDGDLDMTVMMATNGDHPAETSALGDSHSSSQKENAQVNTSPIADMKVGIAFDYMRVKVGEICHLEHFTPALLELFKDGDPTEKESGTSSLTR